jgi:WD40 repeat protein
MIRLLPRSPSRTWLLAGAVWLAGCGALWCVLPYRPRASWPTEEPAVVHGFVPGTSVVLTSMPWSGTIDGPPGPMLGPLVARDAATGEVREWFPDGERLTLVDPGVDGRHVIVGRVIDGRARLFLHDAADGTVIAELPRGGPRAENENDQPRDAYEQFAAFRPDGRQIAYADRVDEQPWLRVWDVQTRREVAALSDAGAPAAWSPEGRTLAHLCHPRSHIGWSARLLEMDTGKVRVLAASPSRDARPDSLVFSRDGKTAVGAHVSGVEPGGPARIFLAWDVTTVADTEPRRREIGGFPAGGLPFTAMVHVGDPAEPKFFPRLAGMTQADVGSVLAERAVEVFPRLDRATRNEYRSFTLPRDFRLPAGHEHLLCHAFSPDNRWLYVSATHADRILELLRRPMNEVVTHRPHLWDTDAGHVRYSLPMTVDPDYVGQYAWSPDGTLLAIAGDTTLAVWDVPPRKRLSWFAAGATLLALPIVVFARRRTRLLRLL